MNIKFLTILFDKLTPYLKFESERKSFKCKQIHLHYKYISCSFLILPISAVALSLESHVQKEGEGTPCNQTPISARLVGTSLIITQARNLNAQKQHIVL